MQCVVTETNHDAVTNLTTEAAILQGMETVAKTLGDKLDKMLHSTPGD